MNIVLKNDFHGSSCTVHADMHTESGAGSWVILTKRQASYAKRKLCGVSSCTCCFHPAGVRGPQYHNGLQFQVVMLAEEDMS